ncbi:hypothetical protein ACLOJK_006398 [Asimina triloba]
MAEENHDQVVGKNMEGGVNQGSQVTPHSTGLTIRPELWAVIQQTVKNNLDPAFNPLHMAKEHRRGVGGNPQQYQIQAWTNRPVLNEPSGGTTMSTWIGHKKKKGSTTRSKCYMELNNILRTWHSLVLSRNKRKKAGSTQGRPSKNSLETCRELWSIEIRACPRHRRCIRSLQK